MKKLSAIFAVLFLTLTLSFAQGTGSSDATTARDNRTTNQPYGTRDNGNGRDWGWIGLLGLAGLTRKNCDRHMTENQDRNVSNIHRAA